MPQEIPTVLIMMFLTSVWIAEAICLKGARHRTPILTLAVCGLLVACLIAQLIYPKLLTLLDRDTTRVLEGEWWRIVSALFFQDAWIIGGLINIATLFAIGNFVEQIQSRRNWLLVSIFGALVAEVFALRWQPIGAGNSIVTCSLAGYLVTIRSFSKTPVLSKFLRILAVAISIFLLATRNLHGVAGVFGVLVGALKWRQRSAELDSYSNTRT